MPTQEEARLKEIMAALDTGAVRPEHLVGVVQALLNVVKQIKDQTEQSVSTHKGNTDQVLNSAIQNLLDIEKRVNDSVQTSQGFNQHYINLKKRVDSELIKIYGAIGNIKPYNDSTLSKKINDTGELLKKVPKQLLPIEIRDSLETLTGDNRLDASAIRGLKDLIKKGSNTASQALSGRGVGLFLDGEDKGVVEYIDLIGGEGVSLDYLNTNTIATITISAVATGAWQIPERPFGAIDGSNTTYTLSYIPVQYSGTLQVDGQTYNEGTNFSIVDNIITFATALDASQGSEFWFRGQKFADIPPVSSSVGIETPTATGNSLVYAVANVPDFIVSDGEALFDGFGYSYSAGFITLNNPVTSFIRSIYHTGNAILETPTGTVDGSNTSFAVSHPPLYIIVDNIPRINGFGYTYSAGTIAVDSAVTPQSFIRSVFSVGTGGVEIPVGALLQNSFAVSNTPKYAIIDNSFRFNGFGFSYVLPTVTVENAFTPQSFIRNIY